MGTRGEWSKDFLKALGNNNPTDDTINLVSSWTLAENTEAKYNPLATTLNYGSNTDFNSVGVKNYQSRQDGINASVLTLRGNHAGYKELREALLNNKPLGAINSGGFDTWGSGSARIATIFATDHRNGTLRSESASASTGIHGGNPEIIRPTVEPNHLAGSGGTYVPEPEPSGKVTASAIQKFVKISFGAMIALTGGILLIISFSRSDAAKTAIDIAKVAAI